MQGFCKVHFQRGLTLLKVDFAKALLLDYLGLCGEQTPKIRSLRWLEWLIEFNVSCELNGV